MPGHKDSVPIYLRLNEVIRATDEGSPDGRKYIAYEGVHTDESIATECGVKPSYVRAVRTHYFGQLRRLRGPSRSAQISEIILKHNMLIEHLKDAGHLNISHLRIDE